MAEPDRDALILEEFFPEGPVGELDAIYIEVVHDPLRIMYEFRGPPVTVGDLEEPYSVLYRVFLGPESFAQFLENQLKAGRDLQGMIWEQ